MRESNYKIFCVIPVYNEEGAIVEVVNSVQNYVDEVVVVDDGSDTEVSQCLAPTESVTILRHIINRGQGAALQTGTEYALANDADIIVHFDGDGQFVAREINDVVRPIMENLAGAVFGSRFLSKRSEIPWRKRNVIIPLARLVNRLFFNINLTDPQSGFRALSKEVASKIRIEQDRMAHCSEILYKTLTSGFSVKEVPITVIYRNFGQKFSGGIKILKELFLGRLIH
jgi:glycosyltransferase involved in cell wall biosynthesis